MRLISVVYIVRGTPIGPINSNDLPVGSVVGLIPVRLLTLNR